VAQVRRSGRSQQQRYVTEASTRLAALDRAIATQRTRRNTSPLLDLLAERERVRGNIASAAAAAIPTLDVWSAAGNGSLKAPRPALYALVGFLLAAVICAYVAYLRFPPRRTGSRAS
jgi:hypothetical protein